MVLATHLPTAAYNNAVVVLVPCLRSDCRRVDDSNNSWWCVQASPGYRLREYTKGLQVNKLNSVGCMGDNAALPKSLSGLI